MILFYCLTLILTTLKLYGLIELSWMLIAVSALIGFIADLILSFANRYFLHFVEGDFYVYIHDDFIIVKNKNKKIIEIIYKQKPIYKDNAYCSPFDEEKTNA